MAKKMKFPVQEAAGIVAGSIAAGFVVKLINDKLPNVPAVVKSLIPIGAGLFLSGQKNTIVKMAGLGMISTGGLNLAKAFVPGIGAMDDLLGAPADQSILSLPADQSILAGDDLLAGDEFVGEDFVAEDFVNGSEDLIMAGNEEISGDDNMGYYEN
jgi:hypothetical protein